MIGPILSMIIAASHAQTPPSVPPSLGLKITGEGDGCRVVAGRETFLLPQDSARLEEHLRSAADQGAIADISQVDENVTYRCIGQVIYLVQSTGLTFSRIGFVSAPDEGAEP